MKSFLSLLLLTSLAAPASAQVFFQNGNAKPVNQTTAQKKRLEREIAFLIGDMKRTCELSDVQVRKLQLAGKGAIASAMEKFEEQQKKMRVMMRQAGGPFAVPEPVPVFPEEDAEEGVGEEEEEEEEEQAEIRPVAPAINFAIPGGFPSQTSRSSPLTKEPRWTKAVKSVVSKEQREKYAETVKERAAFVRKSAVSVFIAKVDRKLLLSKGQREKLTALVDDGFGKEFAARVSRHQGGWVMFGGGPQKPPIAHDELKKFFSEPQLAEWKASFENELNQLKPNGGNMGGAFGNIIINGVGGGAVQIEQNVFEQFDDDQ